MQQHSDLSIPQQMAALTNRVGVFDEYIAFTTGNYQYSCLIGTIDESAMTGSGKLVTVYRTSVAGGTRYEITERQVNNEPIILVNEYYSYSNVGIGQSYNIPHFNQFTAMGIYLFVGMYLFVTFISGGVKLWRRKFGR